MRKKVSLLLFMFISLWATAQTLNVKGIVKDAITGDVLPGVSIIIKGSTTGTQTDFDGLYSLSKVQKGTILVFNYLGYKKKEVVVSQETTNVTLEESAESLDEIVVVGYGTQRKKEVTGAVSVIGSATIEDLKPTRIDQALQGQVAGVNITSTSGSPGAGVNIQIRGVSTNGDSRPLILLDGNVIEDLSVVNPNDVESINILKDATAGIYGVRGANGVILITTKSGRKNTELKSSLNMYFGFQETTRKIPLLNATEYALLANEAFAANGDALPFPSVSGLGQGTNWQNDVFKTAPIASIDYSASKGTEKSSYAFGLSLIDQDGIVGADKSNFNRTTARFNFNTDILDDLKFTSSTIYTNTNKKNLIENTLGSVLFNAINMPATTGVYDSSGNFSTPPPVGTGIEVANPLAQVENAQNRTWINKIAGSYALNYKFLEYFSAETRMQFNYAVVKSNTFLPEFIYGPSNVFNIFDSTFSEYEEHFKDYTFDAFVNYERVFNDVHDVKIMLGTSVFRTQGNIIKNQQNFARGTSINDVRVNALVPNGDFLEIFKNRNNGLNLSYDDRLLSYFTRLQYGYDNKYLFSAVIRRDGSTKFGPQNKFGFFPTASLGWVASEEDFLKDSEVLNFLKFRASYGILGNDRIPPFGFVALLDGEGDYVFNGEIVRGDAAFGRISNPEIRWEKQTPLDLGVDLELYNKVNITIDYFNKKTEDLLVQPQASGLLGVSAPGSGSPFVNAGTVENKGFEFSISYKEEISNDFRFSANYNFTTLQNTVLFVGNATGVLEGGTFGVGQEPPSRMEAGFPIGYFYGYQTNGIFQTQKEVDEYATQLNAAPGDLRFVDSNKDGVIDSDDRTYIGDPIADVTMGLNISLNYKKFDFNAYAFASIGNEIVRNYERTLPLTNRSTSFLDRWTGPGTSNSFPRVTTGANGNSLFSDFFVEDGSFLRLQNVQLGYTVGDDVLKRLDFDKVRFYVSASNLFTLTKYKGFDPTASSGAPIGGGIDQGFYPNPKTFLFGMNVNF
ncbi:SusC/RagA family TonB-linked outer membrane protein [Polaribacter glomeratus]|uniref:SusC/RagA family protein n=1 Tax=Polaribacter glomeratus TaxID=102 RepID=A0A2S7WVB1_9FLAO|nr:TonB-dependent receptor [Polaribacter glomeratus]PQJ81533.1 SusC/RagA family protein [Polaribacter glomeratus]TXD64635.1 TonB-dependent receptor [Polaribacter glomeratus]